MNTEKENLIDPDSPNSIIKAAAKAYSEIWYNDEFFTLNSLAKKLNLSVADLIRHFGPKVRKLRFAATSSEVCF